MHFGVKFTDIDGELHVVSVELAFFKIEHVRSSFLFEVFKNATELLVENIHSLKVVFVEFFELLNVGENFNYLPQPLDELVEL